MGFCRHCGDIVAGDRCKCGGRPADPVVSWNRIHPSSNGHDRWSKTYVSPQLSASSQNMDQATHLQTNQTVTPATTTNSPASNATRRFPRPKSSSAIPLSYLKHGVSDHISLVTSQPLRPPSPLKMSTTLADSENDILPSFLPHEPTLSKVYGSVLQPKATLTLHSCAICFIVFPPDATIYPNPNPSQSEERDFLCRSCFTTCGGSKGICPSCSRPVLALKAEGSFIHSGGNYWHKRCYNCAACFKNIGDNPMVDLLGRPSCPECFDNCLRRDPSTPKKNKTSNANSPITSNPGGLNASYGRKSRENSPALEELEHRLGLVKSGESSPSVGDHGRVLSGRRGIVLSPPLPFPEQRLSQTSVTQLQDVSHDPRLESTQNGFTQCLLSQSPRRAKINSDEEPVTTPPPTHKPSSGEYFQYSKPQSFDNQKSSTSEPKLTRTGSSLSNHATNESPKSSTNYFPTPSSFKPKTPQSASSIGSTYSSGNITSSSNCGKCSKPILNSREGGQFVTVPGLDENDVPQIYHTDCFKCAICSKSFNDTKKGPGQISFVKCEAGPAHVQCSPKEQLTSQRPTTPRLFQALSTVAPLQAPPPFSPQAPNSMLPPLLPFKPTVQPLHNSPLHSKPRFGGQTACPGCHKSVSVMERGVVPGPQGTKWHASCLVCGGRKETTRAQLLGRGREEKGKGDPGCGKKLDSAAKSDGEGGVWCRECRLLLGMGASPQASPTRTPLISSFADTISPSKVTPQFTGTTTIARQFTGLAGGGGILRQLTGGGLSPTRSISPTKQLELVDNGVGTKRPRPKSVVGMRMSKSVDEGRGVFLVRQLTGSTLNERWET